MSTSCSNCYLPCDEMFSIKFMVLWSCLQLHNISCSAHWWPLEAILTLWNPWETAVPNLPCVVLMTWHCKENLTHWCLPHIRALHLSLPHSVLCVLNLWGVYIWCSMSTNYDINLWSISYSTFSGIYSFQEGAMATFRKPQGRQANDASMAMNFLYCDQ